jgi:MFS family permease
MVQEKAVIAKVVRRFIPLLIAASIIAYIDRFNIGMAALTMNADIGLSAIAYGFGAGLFFITYVLFEVPSNIILARVGARLWLARIMFSWGVIALCMAFVRGEYSFYFLRALLGAAEAGLFPGVMFFLSTWLPQEHRARVLAFFWVSVPLSTVIGSPISGLLLGLDGLFGLQGWKWLFILEGLPPILLSFVLLRMLTDAPAKADWLPAEEREWLIARLADEPVASSGSSHTVLGALCNPMALLLSVVCLGATLVSYGMGFFLPQIVKGFGLSDVATGFVSALPYVAGVGGILAVGYISDATGSRRGCVAGTLIIRAICLFIATLFVSPLYSMAFIVATGFFLFAYQPAFWAIPQQFLRGPALAAGIALINALANIGGFVGPYVMGYVRQQTGSFEGGLRILAVLSGLSTLLLLLVRERAKGGRQGAEVLP